jgi:hypothetical protein
MNGWKLLQLIQIQIQNPILKVWTFVLLDRTFNILKFHINYPIRPKCPTILKNILNKILEPKEYKKNTPLFSFIFGKVQ